MISLNDFFGLPIEKEKSDMMPLLEQLGIANEIEKTDVVKSLSKKNGSSAPIVNVGRRQQVLKLLRPFLNEELLPFEQSFYDKEVNTSSDRDRKYAAEDKLLEFALLVASTKSPQVMAADPNIVTVKQLREASFKGNRFEKCWDILSDETRHIVTSYRNSSK